MRTCAALRWAAWAAWGLCLVGGTGAGASPRDAVPVFDEAQRRSARSQMLEAMDQVQKDEFAIKIAPSPASVVDPRAVAFTRAYVEKFWPYQSRILKEQTLGALNYVFFDRNLGDTPEEQAQAQAAIGRHQSNVNQLVAAAEYKELLAEMRTLALDLHGRLPEDARLSYELDQRIGVRADELALRDKITDLELKIQDLANNSPVNKTLREAQIGSEEIDRQFYAGRWTLRQAQERLDLLVGKGALAKSNDVARRGRDLFEELAILRTELAQRKGFGNWRDLVLYGKRHLYAEGYKEADDRIAFLADALASTRPLSEQLYQTLLAETDIKLEEATPAQLGWLLPETATLVADYFPVEAIEERWLAVLRGWGVPATTFDHIHIDNFPRDGKQTHAYMYNVNYRRPVVSVVDPVRLDFVNPPHGDLQQWVPALIYVVQNFRKDGFDEASTFAHELGHAMDYAHRDNPYAADQDSSYAETHSMTMEQLLLDPALLAAFARTRDGAPMSPELARRFSSVMRLVEIVRFRGQIYNALFDLLIWSDPYVKGGESYVDRSRRLSKELWDKYMLGRPREIEGLDPYQKQFSTGHFYDGGVRYIGYIFAQIAAYMNEEYLLNEAERRSGRRDFVNQDFLGPLLIDGYYRDGFLLPFPAANERFTQARFEPTVLVRKFERAVRDFLDRRSAPPRRCDALF